VPGASTAVGSLSGSRRRFGRCWRPPAELGGVAGSSSQRAGVSIMHRQGIHHAYIASGPTCVAEDRATSCCVGLTPPRSGARSQKIVSSTFARSGCVSATKEVDRLRAIVVVLHHPCQASSMNARVRSRAGEAGCGSRQPSRRATQHADPSRTDARDRTHQRHSWW
jgi:hypothetical protein